MLKIFKYIDINSKEALKLTFKAINIKDTSIIYNKYGKPYLKNNKLYFNISHTKNIVIIAIADKEVGIDVQYKCYKPQIINKYFTPKEIAYINKALDKEDVFTTIWTKKEAYVKMIGEGLSYGLRKVNTLGLDIKVTKEQNLYMAVCLKES